MGKLLVNRKRSGRAENMGRMYQARLKEPPLGDNGEKPQAGTIPVYQARNDTASGTRLRLGERDSKEGKFFTD